jgi:hypothetical protein
MAPLHPPALMHTRRRHRGSNNRMPTHQPVRNHHSGSLLLPARGLTALVVEAEEVVVDLQDLEPAVAWGWAEVVGA